MTDCTRPHLQLLTPAERDRIVRALQNDAFRCDDREDRKEANACRSLAGRVRTSHAFITLEPTP